MIRKFRELRDGEGGGGGAGADAEDVDDRMELRGKSRRGKAYPMALLLVFTMVVGVTILMNIHSPFASIRPYTEEERHHVDKVLGRETDQQLSTTSIREHPYDSNGKELSTWPSHWQMMLPGSVQHEVFFCDRTHIRTDVCRLHGNVHLECDGTFVLHSVDDTTPLKTMTVKPYTRKWEKLCMDKVGEVKMESVRSTGNRSRVCDMWHSLPAVVFSTGGYTGNVYHEFHDGLIPLYITTQHLKREVVFVISDYHPWWFQKYAEVIKQLTKYEILDLANLTQSHCFLDVTAGLFIHEELSIIPSIMPKQKSIRDFRALLGRAYHGNLSWSAEDITSFRPVRGKQTGVMPELVIIMREGSRVLLNLDKIVKLAVQVGFNVVILKPDPTTELKKLFWVLNRADVMMGVHGAAMTHFLFMRPGTVFIQVVPLGTDWAAYTYFGEPAEKMGLQYVPYKITPEESSLYKKYGKDDPVLTDPYAVGQQGWGTIKEIYLEGQDVELSLPRFQKTLEEAKRKSKPHKLPVSDVLAGVRRAAEK
ncbi:hypothetical protein Mapa_013479 [Marchantia paleacea]|nr:hypothetical protein Mapa_013479 [Marchantia paleacea]